MTITARIVEDSCSPDGVRLTTFQLHYPRFIHSELMTHRVFSRNASSSRAVPIKKVILHVISDPAEPVEWGSNRPGMQAGEELTGWRIWLTQFAWHFAMWCAILCAWIAMQAGAHKQVVNRILEPWSHISVIVTSTDWDNWFALRNHDDADPTIRELAWRMKAAMEVSKPRLLRQDDWHLPYVTEEEKSWNSIDLLKMVSSARCARVSYLNHDGTAPNIDKDMSLYVRLMNREDKHASPTEHQATPDKLLARGSLGQPIWSAPHHHGNFRGWIQHRKLIERESAPETNQPSNIRRSA